MLLLDSLGNPQITAAVILWFAMTKHDMTLLWIERQETGVFIHQSWDLIVKKKKVIKWSHHIDFSSKNKQTKNLVVCYCCGLVGSPMTEKQPVQKRSGVFETMGVSLLSRRPTDWAIAFCRTKKCIILKLGFSKDWASGFTPSRAFFFSFLSETPFQLGIASNLRLSQQVY